MFGTVRASSAPSSPRPEPSREPVESRTTEPGDQHIPEELLISLTSAVCSSSSSSTVGHCSHHQPFKGCGIRRPDAVWRHPFGRKKYKYFLEQPTSITGAGRDISFLCDAMVSQRRTAPLPPLTDRSRGGDAQDLTVSESLIPEDYHIVTNKGLQSLEVYEDAFTVQLHDHEHNLRAFPSLRPSGRLEAVQLMRMMDNMLEKAGVDQRCEELTELSQMEGLLELVQVEQNIYNIVFHELIRQVSVGCAERGQLLAKLRQRYQSLLERIPCRLKALHTEVVAQRALDRQLAGEIHRVKTSMQQLSIEMSKLRDHDAFVFHQAERAHQQLDDQLHQTLTSSDVVQGYHDLYELQRGRLEAGLRQAAEERDCWSHITLCLALKVISVKKLKLVRQLHICEQSWFRTAEHCLLYLSTKDTHDLNVVMKLMDNWEEQLTAFISQLKKSDRTQCEQISAIKQGIAKWLLFCSTQNKCAGPKHEKTSLETMHEDLKQWSHICVEGITCLSVSGTCLRAAKAQGAVFKGASADVPVFNCVFLAVQCERYEGENLLNCQQTLAELASVQEKWLNISVQLLRRRWSPDGQLPDVHHVLTELERILPELVKELGAQVRGEHGIHKQIMSLHSLMESWVPKLGAVIGRPEMVPAPDWLTLEKALHTWQSLAEEAFSISSLQTENEKDPGLYKEIVKMLEKVQEFRTNLTNFSNGEKQRLSEEVNFIHMAQTRWMLDLLLLMVPDLGKDQKHLCTKALHENARTLAGNLDCFSKYISSSYKMILEEQILLNLHQDEHENEKNECNKLQMEGVQWLETCTVLLSHVEGGPGELPVIQPVTVPRSDIPDDATTNRETRVTQESAELKTSHEAKKVRTEPEAGVEPLVCEETRVKLIGYDGNITERILGESSVHLCGTDELVVTPATDEAQKAFNDLTTVVRLQQELYDSELRVQAAEQRALKAEEALQTALQKIQDLERQLQG